MSERDARVTALAREIQNMGAWATSPLPLQGSKLRFQCLTEDQPKVIAKLVEWGYTPIKVSAGTRVTANGFRDSCFFEVTINEPVPYMTTRPPQEVADEKKSDYEREQLRKYLNAERY